MKYADVTLVLDGVKVTICEYRKPKKSEKTWKSEVGHTFNYVGLPGRGLRKGNSTKVNRF